MSNKFAERERLSILDYPIDTVNGQEAAALIENAWFTGGGMHIITLNAEMLVTAKKNSHLSRVIKHAGLVVPDGAGIVLALKLSGKKIERLPGIEIAELALRKAAATGTYIALIGADDTVLENLLRILPEKYPGIQIVAHHSGFFKSKEKDSIIDTINKSTAKLVLVAMGVPKQEYFIEEAIKVCPQTVFIGVGGSFDIWAGKKKRAPKIWQNLHLEWFYRLCKEPSRFQRICVALPQFAYLVLSDLVSKKVSGTNKNLPQ